MMELVRWIAGTPLSAFVHEYRWVWPIAESLHFCGITVLVGTVGVFDLRLLGMGKGFEPAVLHGLLRFGIAGFGVAAATGVLFIAGTPDQYFFNAAFKVKVVALAAAGANAAAFYLLHFKRMAALGPFDDASRGAKLSAALSLVLLVTIMLAGRMLTFFRPPYM